MSNSVWNWAKCSQKQYYETCEDKTLSHTSVYEWFVKF